MPSCKGTGMVSIYYGDFLTSTAAVFNFKFTFLQDIFYSVVKCIIYFPISTCNSQPKCWFVRHLSPDGERKVSRVAFAGTGQETAVHATSE